MSATDPIVLERLPEAGDTFMGWTKGQLEQAAERLSRARPDSWPRDESGIDRLARLIAEYEDYYAAAPPVLKYPVSGPVASWVNRAWWAARLEADAMLRHPLTAA